MSVWCWFKYNGKKRENGYMIESKTCIDMKKTGMQLKKYAEERGYSVKQIQRYLCLSCPQPIYRWYKGIILPSVDNLLKLSELFQVHMEDLIVKKCEQNCEVETIDYYLVYAEFTKRIIDYATFLAA